MLKYVNVHIQFEEHDPDGLLDFARDYSGFALTVEQVDDAISRLNEAGRMPRLDHPTYVAAGARPGDIVEAPYGARFTVIGLVTGEVDPETLDPTITYKPVRVRIRRDQYAR